MFKHYHLILVSFALILVSFSPLLAQETYINAVPLGTGKTYMCMDTSLDNLYVGKVGSSGLTPINHSTLSNNLKRKIRVLKQKVDNGTATSSDRAKLKNNKVLLSDIKKCIAGNILNDINSACGVVSGSKRSGEARIISGDFCNDNGTPFIRLAVFDSEFNEFICTANIIAPNALLTAAHCVDFDPAAIEAVEGSTTHSATGYTIHPSYDGDVTSTGLNDIAIVFFDNSSFSRQPIAINGSNFLHTSPGESVLIGGYGLDENDGIGELKAGSMLLDASGNFGIYSAFFINDTYPDSNTCGGDSGGPLLTRRSGRWTLTGLTSWGSNTSCGVDGDVDQSYFSNLLNASNQEFIKTYVPSATFWK